MHVARCLTPSEIEQSVRRHAQVRELLADATQPRFEPVASLPDIAQGALEQLHPVPPLVALLGAQENRIDIDHPRDDTGNLNQPFARGPAPPKPPTNP